MSALLKISGTEIAPGERKIIQLKIAKLYDYTDMNIPIEVIRGKKEGPTLLVSAAVHGDELNGIDIIKRLLVYLKHKTIHGTLIAVPIVNVFGFNNRSRYFMDRRELNRSFPGSKKGSLAAKLAYLFTNEIVKKCDMVIDLHTAAVHRNNIPQIRACLDNAEIKKMALSFGSPLVVNSDLIRGSLRQTCYKLGIPLLVYEAGEALRFDETSIQQGLDGILSVMATYGMLIHAPKKIIEKPIISAGSNWTRAPQSGILNVGKQLGDWVVYGDILGHITDPFGVHNHAVYAKASGIIIGQTELPLVSKGDALFHIAEIAS